MFEGIKNFIKGVVSRLFNKNTIEKALNVQTALTNDMQNAISLWMDEYINSPPWRDDKKVFSMNLAAAIASEFAKLVTIEFKSEIANNDFLNKEYQIVVDNTRNITELACAGGGVALKPYLSNGHIEVDIVRADCFYPVTFNSRGEVTAAIFPEFLTKGDNTYIKLEYHNFDSKTKTYTVTNKAFRKKNYSQVTDSNLGVEISLSEVDEWAELSPIGTLANIEKPLFAYFKMPLSNTIDPSSPLGVSIYSRIADQNGLLNQIDKLYSDILWEYEAKQTAIFADRTLFTKDEQNRDCLEDANNRLYKLLDIPAEGEQFKDWSPDIRDTSLFNGLNETIRIAEFQVGLAYGTLSKMQETDKTATEIKASKQRSFQSVKDIQNNLRLSYENLVYGMYVWGVIGKLPVNQIVFEGDNSDLTFNFDDSIMVDKKEELNNVFLAASSGFLKPEYYIKMLYPDKTLDEILKMIPQQQTVKPDPFNNTDE
jgi:A118 family predicted phage portal protein